jgi:hypothetical protein
MTKKIIVSFLMVLFVSTVAFSQLYQSDWKFSKVLYQSHAHGVGVTPDDCIWINVYGRYDSLELPSGSVLVLNSDGSEKGRVTSVTVDGSETPMNLFAGMGRGMSVGPDGKVYHSAWDCLMVFDYQNLQLLSYVIPLDENAITTAVADENGNVVVGFVSIGRTSGYRIFDAGLGSLEYAIPPGNTEVNGTVRDITMTPDGTELYIACTGGTGIQKFYSSDGTFGFYQFEKLIGDYGIAAQTVQLDRKGRLWVGVDYNNVTAPDNFARYDCWDLNTMTIVERIVSTWNALGEAPLLSDFQEGAFNMTRGLAFSNDMKKAYVVDFNRGVQEWEYDGTSNAEQPKAIPEGFALSQNYPNPFNPTTNFSYSVPKASDVRIAVYDLFGREIKTLVNESKDAGTYSITWNGRDNNNKQVSTGVYFYKMQTAGFEKTMKMMLMK